MSGIATNELDNGAVCAAYSVRYLAGSEVLAREVADKLDALLVQLVGTRGVLRDELRTYWGDANGCSACYVGRPHQNCQDR